MTSSVPGKESGIKKYLIAAGSVIGAVLASSCCIMPLLLLTLGVSGAWIGNLTLLEPYKPFFIIVTLIFLGLGFWQVYFKAGRVCAEDSYCAIPGAEMMTKIALWLATGLILLAVTVNYWAPFFY